MRDCRIVSPIRHGILILILWLGCIAWAATPSVLACETCPLLTNHIYPNLHSCWIFSIASAFLSAWLQIFHMPKSWRNDAANVWCGAESACGAQDAMSFGGDGQVNYRNIGSRLRALLWRARLRTSLLIRAAVLW